MDALLADGDREGAIQTLFRHFEFMTLAKKAVEAVASALPDDRILVLKGQAHVADVFEPALFARHILQFFEA